MDISVLGQPAGSYEERNDLAIRSAASDPVTEPYTNMAQSPKSAHAKKALMSNRTSTQLQATNKSSKEAPSKSKSMATSESSAKKTVNKSLPDFIIKRNDLFDKLKHEHDIEIVGRVKSEISVVLDLGLDKEEKPRPGMPVAARAWESTPGSFLRHVDKDVSSDVVVAKLNGRELWDLDRPLEYACHIKYIPFSSLEGRNVFWHSSAHVLGEAAECHYNCLLTHGPPVEQGFFYDMAIAEG